MTTVRASKNSAIIPTPRIEPACLKLTEGISLVVIILFVLYLRLDFMNDGLWLDEAWVANSVLAPSISEMLYYDKWVQTTPPLLLLLIRTAIAFLGTKEVTLRLVPWLAGLLSVLMVALVLRRSFRFPLALLGITFFATNYWALKYAQQVKQFSTDLLVSCLFLTVIWIMLESGRNRRLYWTLAGLGTIGIFLSYDAVFWFPAAIIVVLLMPSHAGKNDRLWYQNILRIDSLFLPLLYGTSFATLYFLFVIPNRDPGLLTFWRNAFLGNAGLVQSMFRFIQNISELLFPREAGLAPISNALMVLCLGGIFRAIIGAARNDRRAFQLLLVFFLPIVTSVIVGFARQYPLLNYTRFVIWILPALVVVVIYAVEPLWIFIERLLQRTLSLRAVEIMVAVLCILYAMTNMWFLKQHPQSREEVREAVEYLRDRMGPADSLFVHGANEQQFIFYTRHFNWSPASVYMGATEWPCCPRNKILRVSNPQASNFKEDIHSFMLRSRGNKVWLLLPAANDPRHWTKMLQGIIKGVPTVMWNEGCREIEKKEFRNALVYAYGCFPKDIR